MFPYYKLFLIQPYFLSFTQSPQDPVLHPLLTLLVPLLGPTAPPLGGPVLSQLGLTYWSGGQERTWREVNPEEADVFQVKVLCNIMIKTLTGKSGYLL
jgi:hypothetical protein